MLSLLLAVLVITPANGQPPVHEWMFDVRLVLDFDVDAVSQESEISMQSAPGLWWNDDGDVVAIGYNGILTTRSGEPISQHPTSNGRQVQCITGDPSAYAKSYFFSSSQQGLSASHYSFVDSTVLDSAVVLHPSATGAVAATRHCDGRDYWVLAGSNSNVMFLAQVTRDGVITSQSALTSSAPRAQDVMVVANSGKRAAWSVQQQRIVVSEFDNTLGQVHNVVEIDPGGTVQGLSFSPNGRLLYVSLITNGKAELWQVSLDAWNAADILASTTVLYSYSGPRIPGMIQCGPDLRLYWVYAGTGHIGTIGNPDVRGLGCNVIPQDISVPIALNGTLPNTIAAFFRFFPGCTVAPQADFELSDTVICVHECIDLIDHSDYLATSWQWQMPGSSLESATNQHPKNICYDTPGSYPVSLIASNANGTSSKTLTVQVVEFVPELVDRIEYCVVDTAETALLGYTVVDISPNDGKFKVENDALRVWGGLERQYDVVLQDANMCQATVSVAVEPHPLPDVVIEPRSATTVCAGSQVSLSAGGAAMYEWWPKEFLNTTNGNAVAAYPISSIWVYVRGTNSVGCSSIDSMYLEVDSGLKLDLADTLRICGAEELEVYVGVYDSVWLDSQPVDVDTDGMVVFVPQLGEQTVTIDVLSGGCTGSTSIVVQAQPLPSPEVSVPDVVCLGDEFTVDVVATGGTVRIQQGTATQHSSTSSIAAQPGSTTVRYTVTNEFCTYADSVVVPTIVASSIRIQAPEAICVGERVEVRTEQQNSVNWYVDGQFATNSSVLVYKARQVGAVDVRAELLETCVATTTTTLSVVALPNAGIQVSPDLSRQRLCVGDEFSVRVDASAQDVVTLQYGSDIQFGTSATFVASGTSAIVVATVTNAVGCETVSSVSVEATALWDVQSALELRGEASVGDTVVLELNSVLTGSIAHVTDLTLTISVPLQQAWIEPFDNSTGIEIDATTNVIKIDLLEFHESDQVIAADIARVVPLLNADSRLDAVVSWSYDGNSCGSVEARGLSQELDEVCLQDVRTVGHRAPIDILISTHPQVLRLDCSRPVEFGYIVVVNTLGQVLHKKRFRDAHTVEVPTSEIAGPVFVTLATETKIHHFRMLLD